VGHEGKKRRLFWFLRRRGRGRRGETQGEAFTQAPALGA